MPTPRLIGITAASPADERIAAAHLESAHGFIASLARSQVRQILQDMNPHLAGTRMSGSFTEASEAYNLTGKLTRSLAAHVFDGETVERALAAAVLDILDPVVVGADPNSTRLHAALQRAGGDWNALTTEEMGEADTLAHLLEHEAMSRVFGETALVDAALERGYTALKRSGKAGLVIPDLRASAEANWIREAGGEVIDLREASDIEATIDAALQH